MQYSMQYIAEHGVGAILIFEYLYFLLQVQDNIKVQVSMLKLINLSKTPLRSMVTMWTFYAPSLLILQRRISCPRG
ncbi:hypothetical protein EDD17DRAFT_755539 [Pisolithus thermaeus]|nr:hypothetical protein EDD17DRAFT_755539 [Pisolithus thermaeus]